MTAGCAGDRQVPTAPGLPTAGAVVPGGKAARGRGAGALPHRDVALSIRLSVCGRGEGERMGRPSGCTPHLSVPQFPLVSGPGSTCSSGGMRLRDPRGAGGCGTSGQRGWGGRVRRASGREGSVRRCPPLLQPPDEFPSQALIDSGGFEILLPIKLTTRWGFPPCAALTLAAPGPPSCPLTARGPPKINTRGRPLFPAGRAPHGPALGVPQPPAPQPDAPPGPACLGCGRSVIIMIFPPSSPPPWQLCGVLWFLNRRRERAL